MLKKKKYAKNVADNEDPDWGSLKKVERPDGDSDDADKKVNIHELGSYFILYLMKLYITVDSLVFLVYSNRMGRDIRSHPRARILGLD